jgi:hypothetical protein
MKDNWINHNTDKLLLFVLVLLAGVLVMHMVHHGADKDALTWAENSFSTVLGASPAPMGKHQMARRLHRFPLRFRSPLRPRLRPFPARDLADCRRACEFPERKCEAD